MRAIPYPPFLLKTGTLGENEITEEQEKWEKKNKLLDLGSLHVECAIPDVCERCQLYVKSSSQTVKRLTGYGSENPEILVVKSHMTIDDTAAGMVFGNQDLVGWLVHYLSESLGCTADELKDKIRFTSLYKCMGGSNKPPAKEYFNHCVDTLITEIAYYKPRFILGIGGKSGNDVYEAVGLDPCTRGHVRSVPRLLPVRSKSVNEPKKKVHLDRGDFPCHVMKVNDIMWALNEPFVQESIIHDFRKIPRVMIGEYPNPDIFAGRNYHVVKDADFAVRVCDYLASLDRFSFDIETGPAPYGLNPYAEESKILCVGFSDQQRNAWCIPLEHKDCSYPDQLPLVREAVKKALTSPAQKTAHNAPFDCSWITLKYGYKVNNLHFDTQVAHGLINENVPHKLKYLSELYTDLEHYDDALLESMRNEKGKKVAETIRCYETHVDLDTLCLYCCADADATEQLRTLFEYQLEQLNLLNYFYYLTMPDVRSVITTHLYGVAFDFEHHKSIEKEFSTELENAHAVMRSMPEWEKWRDAKGMEMKGKGKYYLHPSGWLYRGYADFKASPEKPLCFVSDNIASNLKQDDVVEDLRSLGIMQKRTMKMVKGKLFTDKDIELNVGSPKQLVEFLFTKAYCNLRSTKTTDAGSQSTNAEVLKALATSHPACQAILDIRTWAKAYNTYCVPFCKGEYQFVDERGKTKKGEGFIRSDDLLHPSFIMTGNDRGTSKDKGKGTVTGRKSAVDPPIQTQKSRGSGAKQIKKMYVTRYTPGAELIETPLGLIPATEYNRMRWSILGDGLQKEGNIYKLRNDQQGGILHLDFSQLELRLFAMIGNISWMLERYKDGADLHLELAMEIFDKTAQEALANDKFFRGLAKSFWFGPIYGETAEGIQQDLASKGFHISVDEAKKLLDSMYEKMPEYEAYKRDNLQCLDAHHAVWTVTGRRRYLPTHLAIDPYRRPRVLRQAGNFRIQSPGSDMTSWSWIALNEWLELMKFKARVAVSVHDSILPDVPPGEMPIVTIAANYLMEHVPFAFLQDAPIPIIADAEAGRSWGQLQELGKPIEIPEDCTDTDAFYWSLPTDLWEFVGQGVAPMDVWKDRYLNDSRLDPIKEKCAQIIL